MKRAFLLALIVPFAPAGCDESLLQTGDDQEEDEFAACTTEESLQGQIGEHLGESLQNFELVQLDGAQLLADLREGQEVSIPLMNPDGELVTFRAAGFPESILSPEVSEFLSKGGDQEVTSTPAREPEVYRLDCGAEAGSCGMVVFLDENGSQLEPAVADDELGFTLIESATSLLTNLQGSQAGAETGCQVVYNSEFHGGLNFHDYVETASEIGSDAWSDGFPTAARELDVKIPIVLDADQEFYDMNSSTVSTDYYMINHPENNEVSYFFVGYDMTGGIAGVAGGVCNVPGYDDTFGSDEDHQDNHAWGQQVNDDDGGYAFATLFGRIIVAGHEIGYMLGARHGDGDSNVCAGGSFSNLCGTSMMLSGASGGVAPDFREPFFADGNDTNIVECVGDVY